MIYTLQDGPQIGFYGCLWEFFLKCSQNFLSKSTTKIFLACNHYKTIYYWFKSDCFSRRGDIAVNLPREIKFVLNFIQLVQMRPIIKYYEVSFLLRDDTSFSARKRSLGQGNVFTPVYHSVHREGRGSVWRRPLLDRDPPEQRPPGQRPPGQRPPLTETPRQIPSWTETPPLLYSKERPVRILLECILFTA